MNLSLSTKVEVEPLALWRGLRARLWLSIVCCTLLATLFSPLVRGAVETLEFSSPEKKALYRKLTQELRCLKCQNQNLADSPAGLAEDLKREIFRSVEEGKSSSEIIDFMVARYGDFILYRPAIKPLTLVLWGLPFLLLGVGVFVVFRFAKSSRMPVAETLKPDGSISNIGPEAESLVRARRLLADQPVDDAQQRIQESPSLPTDRS